MNFLLGSQKKNENMKQFFVVSSEKSRFAWGSYIDN